MLATTVMLWNISVTPRGFPYAPLWSSPFPTRAPGTNDMLSTVLSFPTVLCNSPQFVESVFVQNAAFGMSSFCCMYHSLNLVAVACFLYGFGQVTPSKLSFCLSM